MKSKRRFWLLIAISIPLLGAGIVWTLPENEIRRLGERLNATNDVEEAAKIVQRLLMSNRRSALDAVVDYANESLLRDVDEERRFLVVVDPSTNKIYELYGLTEWNNYGLRKSEEPSRVEKFKSWLGFPLSSDAVKDIEIEGSLHPGACSEIRVIKSDLEGIVFYVRKPDRETLTIHQRSLKNWHVRDGSYLSFVSSRLTLIGEDESKELLEQGELRDGMKAMDFIKKFQFD